MTLSEISKGSTIEIFLKRDGYNYRMLTKVRYVGADCIGVDLIASSQKLFRFRDTDVVDIVYKDDARYWKWENVKPGIATFDDGVQMHVFSVKARAVEYNRRTQYRLPIDRPFKLKYETTDINTVNDGRKKSTLTPEIELDRTLEDISERYREVEIKGHLRDISEGGASFDAEKELPKGTFISFTLNSNQGPVYCRGVIIRAKKNVRGFYDYGYGCSFVETSKNYVQFFYAEQRRQLYENSDPNNKKDVF